MVVSVVQEIIELHLFVNRSTGFIYQYDRRITLLKGKQTTEHALTRRCGLLMGMSIARELFLVKNKLTNCHIHTSFSSVSQA